MTKPALQFVDNNTGEETEVYRWSFPGAPIRVDTRLEVVRRLRAEADQADTDGHAVGGVLLGCSRSQGTIEISDYLLIPCEPNPIRGYILNAAALGALGSRHGDLYDDRISVIGYFRTQQEQSLVLRDDEIDVVRQHFNDPEQVVLLIKASPGQCTAGFLFWDRDYLNPFSFMEFPLDAGLLWSERTTHSSEPQSNEPSSLGLVEQVEAVVSEKRRRGLLLRSLPMVSAAAVVLAALLMFLMRDRFRPAPKHNTLAAIQMTSAPRANFPLRMEVEARGNGLDIRWNPQSVPVMQAREGRLVIIEHGQDPQIMTLGPEQLTSGHVYFQPSAKQIEFRLEVVDSSGLVAKESVLALSSKLPGKVQSIPIVHSEDDTLRARNARVWEALHPTPRGRTFTVPPPRQADTAEGQPIVLDPPAPMLSASPVPSPPLSQNTNRIGAPSIRPPVPTPAAQDRLPAATDPKPAQISTFNPSPTPIVPAERFYAPVPKKKVNPILQPAIAALIPQDANIEVVIRVQIDQTGSVVGGRALPHTEALTVNSGIYSQLEKAAVDAAMRWRFEPARLGDKVVPSDHEVVFLFRHRSP